MAWTEPRLDLNPIEHLWDKLERRIRKQKPPPKAEADCFKQIEKSIPKSYP